MSKNDKIIIYCDGGCRGNARANVNNVGGYGVVIRYGNETAEIKNAERGTTNNQQELKAAIAGLQMLETLKISTDCIEVYADSAYVVNGITKWIYTWMQNGWKTADGEVKNKYLWQELQRLSLKFMPKFNHVKGHSGIADNERADELANIAMDNL